MTKIITLGNFKGGVGKTANSTLISYTLAKKGYKTLIVDLDPQGNATNIMLKTAANLSGELKHFDQSLMKSVEDGDLSKSIINITNNLDLLASAPDFSLFSRYMEKYTNYNERVKQFGKLVDKIKDNYDYIIIDTPPTISIYTDSALYISDYCLIVMQTHEHSFEGAQAYIEYIRDQMIGDYHAPKLDLVGILAVLMQANAPVDELTIDSAIEMFGDENIFKTRVNFKQRIKRFGVTGITNDTKFDTKVFDLYEEVTDELLERIDDINEAQ
ncbi:ParA family protein [Lactobacillaceae bacterium Melli_B3]